MRRELREIAQWLLTEIDDLFLSMILIVMLHSKDEERRPMSIFLVWVTVSYLS